MTKKERNRAIDLYTRAIEQGGWHAGMVVVMDHETYDMLKRVYGLLTMPSFWRVYPSWPEGVLHITTPL